VPNSRRWTWPGRTWELTLCSAAEYWSCYACLLAPGHGSLTPQEQLAVEFLDLLSGEHHMIDDAFYKKLGEHFTAAQIVELGFTCASTMGLHRFLHTLDIYGDSVPVIDYSPDQVDSAAHD
jgi:hypothetical protein